MCREADTPPKQWPEKPKLAAVEHIDRDQYEVDGNVGDKMIFEALVSKQSLHDRSSLHRLKVPSLRNISVARYRFSDASQAGLTHWPSITSREEP
jgi:hypothetical protein